jgi:hypothetical protein
MKDIVRRPGLQGSKLRAQFFEGVILRAAERTYALKINFVRSQYRRLWVVGFRRLVTRLCVRFLAQVAGLGKDDPELSHGLFCKW